MLAAMAMILKMLAPRLSVTKFRVFNDVKKPTHYHNRFVVDFIQTIVIHLRKANSNKLVAIPLADAFPNLLQNFAFIGKSTYFSSIANILPEKLMD